MSPKKIALIIGTQRPMRVGANVTEWVHQVFKTSTASSTPEITLLDVKDFNLPLYNEAVHPAMVPYMAQFEHEHSKKWSAAIQPFDGYILVSGEYNVGIPGAVKNAIDYLYNEWVGKPMLIVSYGIYGGKNASESLTKTLSSMKLNVLYTKPQLTFAGPGMEDVGLATTKGKIGDDTMKLWEATGKESLVKGFEELVTALELPPPVTEKTKGTQPEP